MANIDRRNGDRGAQPIVDFFRAGMNVAVRTPGDLADNGIIVSEKYIVANWGGPEVYSQAVADKKAREAREKLMGTPANVIDYDPLFGNRRHPALGR